MAEYDKELIDRLWNGLRKAEGKDADKYRLDAAGALIERDQQAEFSETGWQIDHTCPKDLLKSKGFKDCDIDEEFNLRPFNTLNNEVKSSDYPNYIRARYYDKDKDCNVEDGKTVYTVDQKTREAAQKRYNLPADLTNYAPNSALKSKLQSSGAPKFKPKK